MKYFIGLALWSFTALAQQSSPVLDPNKYTVCAITINSDDERKVFDAQIKKHPSKFNPIVELTDFNGGSDWFKKSCESGIKCDQLIISGHFGGDFFSEKGDKHLTMKEMETASCNKSCDGVLKNPLEIFLFGCNTLSNKDEDSRTPAQYLQVLLNDGIPLTQAEMVVESRYGNVGDSHRGIMQRVFSGEKKQIYGFDSIGPSGKNVKGFLNNYFAKVSAPARLELLESKRLMEKVDLTNKALADSLKMTAFTQCAGGSIDDPITKNLCALQDESISVENRIDLIQGLLAEENYLGYLPAINYFFKTHSPQYYNDQQKNALLVLTENKVIKGQIDGLIATTKSLGLKSEWLSFSRDIGYISKDESDAIMRKAVIGVFDKKLSPGMGNILCKLDYSANSNNPIKLSDLKYKNFGEEELQALQCINASDPEILTHVKKRFKVVKDPDTQVQMMEFLINNLQAVGSVDASAIATVKPLLLSKDPYYKRAATEFFSTFAKQDATLHRVLQSMILSKDEEHQLTAIVAYDNIGKVDAKVIGQIMKVLKTCKQENTTSLAISSLIHMEVKDQVVINELKNIHTNKELNMYDKERLRNYLKQFE